MRITRFSPQMEFWRGTEAQDLVLDVEAKFGMTIDDSSVTKLKKVGDIVELVQALVKSKEGI